MFKTQNHSSFSEKHVNRLMDRKNVSFPVVLLILYNLKVLFFHTQLSKTYLLMFDSFLHYVVSTTLHPFSKISVFYLNLFQSDLDIISQLPNTSKVNLCFCSDLDKLVPPQYFILIFIYNPFLNCITIYPPPPYSLSICRALPHAGPEEIPYFCL